MKKQHRFLEKYRRIVPCIGSMLNVVEGLDYIGEPSESFRLISEDMKNNKCTILLSKGCISKDILGNPVYQAGMVIYYPKSELYQKILHKKEPLEDVTYEQLINFLKPYKETRSKKSKFK